MDSANYRAAVERAAHILKALRKENGISATQPPCAFNKVQLRDWLASLRIEDEGERMAYVCAITDYWFAGIYPSHLKGTAKAYFEANYERFEDRREDSFRKAGLLDFVDLARTNDNVFAAEVRCDTGCDTQCDTGCDTGCEPSVVNSHELPTTSYEPLAMDYKAIANGLDATNKDERHGYTASSRASCAACNEQFLILSNATGSTCTCPRCGQGHVLADAGRTLKSKGTFWLKPLHDTEDTKEDTPND